MDSLVNRLSYYLYDTWCESKKAEGFHLPRFCPTFDHDDEENSPADDLIHCHLCLSDLDGFENLPNSLKTEYLKKAEKMIDNLKRYQIQLKDLA